MLVMLSFGNCYNYKINYLWLVCLMSFDKEEVLYMGVWDRFKDCFRIYKK